MRCGQIVLKTPKGSIYEKNISIIEKILHLVAKNSPVDLISRMVKLNTTIHQFTREKDENIN